MDHSETGSYFFFFLRRREAAMNFRAFRWLPHVQLWRNLWAACSLTPGLLSHLFPAHLLGTTLQGPCPRAKPSQPWEQVISTWVREGGANAQAEWENSSSDHHHPTCTPHHWFQWALAKTSARSKGLDGLCLFPDDSLPSLNQSHAVSAINSRKL